MGVKINSTVWNSIFAVPTSIVDEHIKMAGGQQLKVLLYVLRHSNEDISVENIATGIGMSVSDVKDAMQYWISVGIILEAGSKPVAEKEITVNTNSNTRVDVTNGFIELPDVVPTHEQVTARLLESPELKALYNEAQLKFGKTIGYDIQAKLLMLYDHYGLPVEIILTIIEYAVSQGKSSIKYIEAVAKDWASRGIVTLEAADEHIKQLQSEDKLWKKFAASWPGERLLYTDKRMSYLKKWHLDRKQSFELIYFAAEEMINRTNKISFAYMDKILDSWYEQHFKSPVDVLKNISTGTSVSGSSAASTSASAKSSIGKSVTGSTSYDLGKYQKKAQQPIEYKRRNSDGK